MKKSNPVPGLFAALSMLLLILDSKIALQSAAEGIDLCLRTVVPSLLPFFILSGILVSDLVGRNISFLRPLGKLLGMPEGSESLLISGFLGGYPVGAKAVRDFWAAGCLRKKDAERLLGFCSNAGPAFLFGMAAPMFSSPFAGWMLWFIQILSALMVGLFSPESSAEKMMPSSSAHLSIPDALKNALSVTAQVCGWVILFRILNGFLTRWFLWFLAKEVQTTVMGFLELANGCMALTSIQSEKLRFLLCSAMLSFGGICVLMQTLSAAKGLSLKYYTWGKLLQTGFSLLFALAYVEKTIILWFIPLPTLLLCHQFRKKSGNPQRVVV